MLTKKPTFFFLSLLLLVLFFVGFSSGYTQFSFAAQTLICPTPKTTGNNELQLIPCYVTGAVESVVKPTANPLPSINLILPSAQPTPAAGTNPPGQVCQDDMVLPESSVNTCSCSSFEEHDLICQDSQCSQDGGHSFDEVGFDGDVPKGTNCVFQPKGASNPLQAAPAAIPMTPPPSATNCAFECNSKPIIYLYPTQDMNVNVSVSMQGHITTSIPQYPQGGWQNVEAHPDGTLIYNGRSYRELYYESETIKAKPINQGVFIPSSQLKPQLEELTQKLGLNSFESNEFVTYWVPRLNTLHSPYILFSLFDQTEKAKVDDVQITPRPATFIDFLAYFKPVENPYPIQPLQLPEAPKRTGFTAVEWGGTVDTN